MTALAARTQAVSTSLRADCALLFSTTAEVYEHVDALVELLRQPGTRLCPPAAAAATNAALALLSGLRVAQLRLRACDWDEEQGDALMAALEGCQQRLLSALQQGVAPPTPAPAPAPAARPASCSDARGSIGRPPGNRRHEELARIVGRLGCSTHQWQAEQAGLARRTSRALQAERQAGGSARHGSMPTSLDSLLREAVATPAWHAPSGQRSTVHAAVQQLLWVLRQLPPGGDAAGAPAGAAGAAEAALGAAPRLPQHRLSEEGWAAYWMLEPKALQQTLAEILQAATQQQQEQWRRRQQQRQAADDGGGPPPNGVPHMQHLLARHPHWAATSAAAAAHPALHLAMRHTLHAWLAASGTPAVWSLLLHFLQAALDSTAAQQRQHGGGLLPGQLPAQLRLLYPPGLVGAAAALLTQQPSEAGVEGAVAHLQLYLQGPAGSEAAALAAQQQQACGLEPLPDAAARCQAVWQLQLDAAACALFCLRRLPLRRLLQMAAAHGSDSDEDAAAGAVVRGDGAGDAATAPVPAAAEYIALLLWPGEPRRQQALASALQGQLAGVSLAALQPCLEQLQGWQHLLQAHCAGSST